MSASWLPEGFHQHASWTPLKRSLPVQAAVGGGVASPTPNPPPFVGGLGTVLGAVETTKACTDGNLNALDDRRYGGIVRGFLIETDGMPTYYVCTNRNTSSISGRHISYGGRLQGDTVRIGCASGFWGDTMTSTPQLLHKGKIDYLVLDYLSEITMSLLAAMKRKDNAAGYTPDFVQTVISPHIKIIQKKGVKVIANAGGVNPTACALALKAICEQANVHLNIAVVSGDDLMDQAADLLNSGVTEMYSGITMPKTVTSINAYFGAGPIARALDLGADIVVTGRCVDSALVLGPLLHKFKWSFDDFERFSQASLAGHLIECGAQVTGGIFTDWHTVPDWSNIGFPIVECAADGSFVVTKPPGTGGLVSKGTVSEQLLYEIGDPACYELPDVNADFSQVTLEEVKGVQDAVFVTGAKGMPPSSKYKASYIVSVT
ncbi:hypothetical protein DPMN_097137 [Dreissena polymorpha]|uniref:Acyclic terpene utilisation N-terminal domain-containing protein n=1 Tax=Dreissena polymorpha TaxID=45954 RepID=A0A9D4LCE6_DREPO|nr:hypothetical protein DPMN_097137 [Dreissena polymorpha]